MELHLPRSEILRQVRALVGMQTNEGLAAQVSEQHLAILQAAILKVQQDCRWVNAQDRITVTLGKEQNVLNYPAGAGPGSVMAMAVWDGINRRYYPIENRLIPVQADLDILQAEGGANFTGVQARPRYFEQRAQIQLWPFSDQEYQVRIDYMRTAQLTTDDQISIYDAQLIIFAAAAVLAGQMADEKQATYLGGLYTDRLHSLKAWQNAGSRFPMDTEADFGENEFGIENLLPTWDRRPTMPPLSSNV